MSYIIWLVVGYFVGYACINFIRWLCSPDSTVQDSKEEIKTTKVESTEDHSEDFDEMMVPKSIMAEEESMTQIAIKLRQKCFLLQIKFNYHKTLPL